MRIKRHKKYTSNLFVIPEHIAKDKILANRKFKSDIDKIDEDLIEILDIFNRTQPLCTESA